MATFAYDVLATVGTYKVGDEEKKRYLKVGAAFTNQNGDISIKLDAVPVSPEWSGWLSLYKPKDREDSRPQRSGPATPKPRPAARPPVDDDDEIPFSANVL